MEWLAVVLFGIIAISIAFNILEHVLHVAGRVLEWLTGPKEWWSGFLVHGTFRPRISTLLLGISATLALCAVAFLLFVLSLGSSSNWVGMGALGVLFVTPLASKKLWTYLRKREHIRVQRKRDERAQALGGAISSGAPPHKYCLYLRPFTVTGKVPICVLDSTMQAKTPKGKPLPPTQDQRFLDFETLLAMALDSYAPLIGLGHPGEQVGAGRIQTADENWQTEFLRLASAAHLILLIPSSRKGTAWELNTVLEDPTLLSKTVFIIPPDSGTSAIYGDTLRSFEANAGTDILRLASCGNTRINIPKNGVVFRWDQTARCFSFSAPLITYVQPSPIRFLLDLWLSRDTVVVSGWRLRSNLLSVGHFDPRVRQAQVSTSEWRHRHPPARGSNPKGLETATNPPIRGVGPRKKGPSKA